MTKLMQSSDFFEPDLIDFDLKIYIARSTILSSLSWTGFYVPYSYTGETPRLGSGSYPTQDPRSAETLEDSSPTGHHRTTNYELYFLRESLSELCSNRQHT